LQVFETDSLWWSPLGRLDSLHYANSQGNSNRVSFGYDAWGRQIRRTLNAFPPTRYLYDGDAAIF
jgi:YD repeat-containing protein